MSTSPVRRRRTSNQEIRFENLEPRNLLAADLFGAETLAANFSPAESSPADLVSSNPTQADLSHLRFANVGNAGLIYQLSESVPVDLRLRVLELQTGIGDKESFQLQSVKSDSLGFTHFKYQQMAFGIPVDNGVYSVHARNGMIETISGDLIEFDSADPAAKLSERSAFESAIHHVMEHFQDGTTHSHADIHGHSEILEPVEKPHFAWQDSQGQTINGLFPVGELTFVESGEAEVSTAWRFEIQAHEPLFGAEVFVDANSGEVLKHYELIRSLDVPATGTTLFNGNVSFVADSFGSNPDYRLVSNPQTTAPGVDTLDLQNLTDYGQAVDVVSPTPDFDSINNPIGVQTHYGAQAVADFYADTFQRNSFNGNGGQLSSYFSYDNDYNNAFWNGFWLTFGDGDGVALNPLVSIDIIGHEFTHGVNTYTADLIYNAESGALDESFADIFGEAAEMYATGSVTWSTGSEIFINGGSIREFQNPKANGEPDTYLGQNWWFEAGDNGGVHTNGTVQNHWFYILSEGKTGTNDNGDAYDVSGIGFADASQIAYRNLTEYLTPVSQYFDSRAGSIQAAADLFGVDSPQFLATEAAWDAVGVYGNSLRFNPTVIQESIGSLIYADASQGEVFFQQYVEETSINLDAGQSISLHATGDTLIPSLTITDPVGNVIGSVTGTSSSTYLQSVEIPTSGKYGIEISGANQSVGEFDIELMLNANFETEVPGGISNDDIASAESLDQTSVPLGVGGADRLAIMSHLGQSKTIHAGDDFESGVFGPQWALSHSLPNGKIENWGGPGTVSGTQAMFMHQNPNQGFNLNEAILTVDMTGLVGTQLEFYVGSWHDELHYMPFNSFTGQADADGVSVSVDGNTWYTMLDYVETPYGEYQYYEYDLDSFAASKGISLDGIVQFKFQQYDNDPIYSDGIGWDDIAITEDKASEDWYSFTLDAGETASISATTVSGPQDLMVQVYDSSGNLLQTGNLHEAQSSISQFVNTGSNDTFYIRTTGSSQDYSLVVTRGADYDIEPNTQASPQDITDVDGVLGSVFRYRFISADPDDRGDNAILDNAFAGLTISNEFGIENVRSADTDEVFPAPTGTMVFAPEFNAADGWNEGLDELRVDFDEPQFKVSIDIGSDDNLDIGWLKAYGSNGVLLEQVTSGGIPFGGSQTLVIDRGVAEIASIVASGFDFHITPIDNLQYTDFAIDDDFYSVDAVVGQQLDFHGILPGEGDFDFDNGLDSQSGSMLGLELFDPNGNLVATGNELVSHTATMNGDYVLRVYAQLDSGEYYISRTATSEPVEVQPYARKLLDGTTSDPLSSLQNSDDIYFQLTPPATTNLFKQKLDVILIAEVAQSDPSGFGYRLESSMTGGPSGDVIQTISVFNEVSKEWDEIDVRAVETNDTVTDAFVSGNVSDYLHPLTGEVKARMVWKSEAFTGTPFNWTIDIDQAVWLIS